MSDFDFDDELAGGVAAKKKRKTRMPRRYKVLLHNDDYTTTEFVVTILMVFFHKTPGEATHVMMQVHLQGVGVAGIYPKEVAETKVAEVTAEARAQGMPLLLTTEAQ